MKFPRNSRIFSGQLDAAPFISVFFLLLIFIILGNLVYTPGVRIDLPADDMATAGVDGATIAVAVDAEGKFYFQNQVITEAALEAHLRSAVRRLGEGKSLTLVVFEDKAATRATLDLLGSVARRAGIQTIWEARLPRSTPIGLQNP